MSRIFGAIRQNGYVVRDIEAAMKHWSTVLGVGPWFYTAHAPIQNFSYRGMRSNVDVAIALANSGPLQLELIQQHNDAPSLYRNFLNAGQEGLQHIAYWTEKFATDRRRAINLGFHVGHEGVTGRYGPFVMAARPTRLRCHIRFRQKDSGRSRCIPDNIVPCLKRIKKRLA
jgi:hypothetical protein